MKLSYIKYFRDCYQEDNQTHNIWNIFDQKDPCLKVLNKADSLSLRKKEVIEVPGSYGLTLKLNIENYRREKSLITCCYLVTGKIKTSNLGKARNICTPLISFYSECIYTEGFDRYTIALEKNWHWNKSLINQIIPEKKHQQEFYDSFDRYMTPPDIEEVVRRIVEFPTDFDLVIDDSKLTAKLVNQFKKPSVLKFYDCSAIHLANLPKSSRGVIDELNQIINQNRLSNPLLQLAGSHFDYQARAKKTRVDLVPGILSLRQQEIINKSAQFPVSMLVGPPGTGKSYTIAALALERFLAGESVLIVTSNEHAIDVIRNKLIRDMKLSPDAVMRAGSKQHFTRLKASLDDLLLADKKKYSKTDIKNQLNRQVKTISRLEKRFHRKLQGQVKAGRKLEKKPNAARPLSSRLLARLFKQSKFHQRKLSYHLRQIQNGHLQRIDLISQHINNQFSKNIDSVLKYHRSSLVNFRLSLNARTAKEQEEMVIVYQFRHLLELVPIWLCSLDGLNQSLPLDRELFGLVIIDEATQCDIASTIPAIQRAQRALLVGDPKQLRHISFLSKSKEQELRDKNAARQLPFSYRNHSAIDLGQRLPWNGAVVKLDEHYRGAPDLIDFSNQAFYENQLRVMTQNPLSDTHQSVTVVKVEGGQRIQGVNQVEAQQTVKRVQQLIGEYEGIPQHEKPSIGIISFFRDQAQYIESLLFENIDVQLMHQHRIRAGTPYSFQGEERDTILLSCAFDDQSPEGTLRYMNRDDVFNVAVTRAREHMQIFVSGNIENIKPQHLLSRYLRNYERQNQKQKSHPHRFEELSESLVNELVKTGYEIHRNYPIAGLIMDLVITREEQLLALDLVGFPGEKGEAMTLQRYKIFERTGLTIMPVSFTEWTFSPEELLADIDSYFVSKTALDPVQERWNLFVQSLSELARVHEIAQQLCATWQQERFILLFEKLLKQYQELEWILGEKLNPGELTYIKYQGLGENLLVEFFKLLNQEADFSPERIDYLEEQCGKTLDALYSMTQNWKSLNAQSSDLQNTIADAHKLAEQVKKYSRF